MANTSSSPCAFFPSEPAPSLFPVCVFRRASRSAMVAARGASVHRSNAQSTDLKNGWFFTSSAPPLVPSLCEGSLCNSLRSKSFSSLEVAGALGNSKGWWMMLWNVCSRRPARNGVAPKTISWMNMPNSHQSIELVWPVLFRTSGARYSSVPTKEFVNAKGSATMRGYPPSERALKEDDDDAPMPMARIDDETTLEVSHRRP
mmetsp:Transcript_5555/g.23471  ORF Transcript_5555/g.23471 Transcript_5555/m.23471 type:complete len:202 (-) Transcript_5555:2253-2858(-)